MATRGQALGGWRRLELGHNREEKTEEGKGKAEIGFILMIFAKFDFENETQTQIQSEILNLDFAGCFIVPAMFLY